MLASRVSPGHRPPDVCFSLREKLKKYCPDDHNEQHFFKYFLISPAVFEKIAAEIVVCSILGADELMSEHMIFILSTFERQFEPASTMVNKSP